jgi:two-component system cell cycle sensor histidine kinase/response regulator CckA
MGRGKKRTRLLLIEEQHLAAGSISIVEMLSRDRAFELTTSARPAEALEILARERFDAVLLYRDVGTRPDDDPLQTIHSRYPDIPIIVICRVGGGRAARDAVKHGATDCLFAEELSAALIGRSVRYAIERTGDRHEITRLNAELERRVEERTAHLERARGDLSERSDFNFALFEYNPIETIVVNRDGRVVNFNRAKRLSKGRLPEIGTLMYRDYAGRHSSDMRAELMSAMDSGAVRHFPEQWYGDHCLSITISPFSQGAIITSQDITAQKTAQKALKESEEKYRLVVETALDGIVIVQNDRFGYLNPAACTIIGHPRGALFGREFIDFVYPGDRDDVLREYRRKASGDPATYPTPFRFVAKDGSPRWVEAIAVSVSWEGEPALLSFIRDISERVKSRDALKESEKKYRELVETLEEGIWVIDRDGSTTYANPRMADMLGYGIDEMIGRHLFSFMDVAEVPLAARNIERRKEGIRESHEFEFLKKNGDRLFARLVVSPLIDEQGRYAGALAAVSDVTEQKRAEALIRESEERYRELVENIEDIMYVTDERGNITYVNRASERFTGFGRDELIEKNFSELLAPESYDYAGEIFKRQLEGEDVGTFELRLKKRDGEIIVLETRERPVWERDRIVEVHGLGRDITDRKKTEEVLRQFEEKWRNFIETSRDVIFLTNLDGKVIDINPAGLELSGYTREEFVGKDISENYRSPAERGMFISMIMDKGFVKDIEIDLSRKGGSLAHCLITATQRRDRNGDVIGFQGIIKDITEKKNLEQQLIHAQKMEAIVALAGGIAHNFNNILVGIMGYSEYLLSKKNRDDPDYKALKTIHEGTMRASTLVKQLLSTARIGQYHPTRVNLNEVIEDILPLVLGTFNKSIEIVTHLAGDLATIHADTGQLEQSLLNLCINARDAMPSGGSLIIETANKVLDRKFVDAHLGLNEGAYVVLSVSDTGVGMPSEVSERIFEPFFTTKEQAGGKGMGLATVYGIMKNHGGRITVYSELGKGTTFRLYFPAVEGASSEEGTGREEADRERRTTILLIDDDPVVRELWSGFLLDQGYRVIAAEDGDRAVEIVKKRPDSIDLVIVDLVMPGMGGKDTIRKLREVRPDVRVLASSGYSANGQARDILEMNIEGFIQKPSQLSELIEIVKEALK